MGRRPRKCPHPLRWVVIEKLRADRNLALDWGGAGLLPSENINRADGPPASGSPPARKGCGHFLGRRRRWVVIEKLRAGKNLALDRAGVGLLLSENINRPEGPPASKSPPAGRGCGHFLG